MLPGRRGMKFADLTQDCDVHFTKAFWSINENPNIRVCIVMKITNRFIYIMNFMISLIKLIDFQYFSIIQHVDTLITAPIKTIK